MDAAVSVSMIGTSPVFIELTTLLSRIAGCDASVLIEGETGTGKELAARAVHAQSARCKGPFVPVNCGAIPDSLLESELFGHRKGAFTDAKQTSPGVLLLAHGGTVFLDEVDALTPKAQVALLRFLQERKIRPLGGEAERSVDVRVIAACNRRLSELAASGEFRADLYYRLNVLSVELPPLRHRGMDVWLLAEQFLRNLARRYHRNVPLLSEESRTAMLTYSWPGNVRELENLIERELLLSESADVLHLSKLVVRSQGDDRSARARAPEPLSYREAKARVLEAFDRRFLSSLMGQVRGNVTAAARVIGKERRDLGRLLRKYGIVPAEYRNRQSRQAPGATSGALAGWSLPTQ